MSQRKRNLPRGWYPLDRKDCEREIESFLAEWSPPHALSSGGVGGIVPHAGWYFSGGLAAKVFCALKSKREVEMVVLYGGHLGPEDLPLIVTEDTWETPLGDIEIHQDFVKNLMKRIKLKRESPSSGDNTIEVQLSMVKYFFPGAKLLAVRSPHSIKAVELGEEIAKIAQAEGISALAIGSTDLTHYGPNYDYTIKGLGPAAVKWVKEENDQGFIVEALRMNPEGLLKHAGEEGSACSAGAAASAVATCRGLGAKKGRLLEYRTSYDILPNDSFVGYAGIVY